MNYLAHFLLATSEPDLLVGGFLGDVIKGRLAPDYLPDLHRGIRLHRAIDSYTDQHRNMKQSHARFEKPYRRFAPIICDIAYDHFLATRFPAYHHQTLAEFAHHTYNSVLNHAAVLPEPALRTIKRMQSHNALESYAHHSFIDKALKRINQRLKRDNPLDSAFGVFLQLEQALEQDFEAFMPDVIQFSKRWIESNPLKV